MSASATRVRLGIDFGTSNTVSILERPGLPPTPLLFDGSPVLPSAVFATGDRLLVGRDAERAAMSDPACFEPHPKRCIADGTVLLGRNEFRSVDLAAAVLSRVAAEARRVAGVVPGTVVLTHPAGWANERLKLLSTAAHLAGLPTPRFASEPVAAATHFVNHLGHTFPDGSHIVVYDLGGGTFDVSVVRMASGNLEVTATGGLPDVGGVDIDFAIVRYLEQTYPGEDGQWPRLREPETPVDRRHRRGLWRDVRDAKEILSRESQAALFIPVLDVDAHLTRDELESLARPLLRETVALTMDVLAGARIGLDRVAGLFLVGGASRMPLSSTMLMRETRIAPTVLEQPELVVANGAIDAPGRETLAEADGAQTMIAAMPPVVVEPPPRPVYRGVAKVPARSESQSSARAVIAVDVADSAPVSSPPTLVAPAPAATTSAPPPPAPASPAPSSAMPVSAPPAQVPPPRSAPPSAAPSPTAPVSGPPAAPVSGPPTHAPVSPGPSAAPVSGPPAAPVSGPSPAAPVSGPPMPTSVSPAPPPAAPVSGPPAGAQAAPVSPAPSPEPPSASAAPPPAPMTVPAAEGPVTSVALTAAGALAIARRDSVTVTDLSRRSGSVVLREHDAPVVAAGWSPDGDDMLAVAAGDTVTLWRRDDNVLEALRSISCPDEIKLLSWSRQGLTTAMRTEILVWDARTGQCRRTWRFSSGPEGSQLRALVWHADGRKLAAGGSLGTIKVFNATDDNPSTVLNCAPVGVRALAFSPDGDWLVSGDAAGGLRIWRLGDSSDQHLKQAHDAAVQTVAWSPDGKLIASGGIDGLVRLWDAGSGRDHGVLEGHAGTVTGLCWSADGHRVYSGSADGTVRGWDVSSAAELDERFG